MHLLFNPANTVVLYNKRDTSQPYRYETLITKYKLCLNSFKESTLQNPERTQHFNGILKQHGINI